MPDTTSERSYERTTTPAPVFGALRALTECEPRPWSLRGTEDS